MTLDEMESTYQQLICKCPDCGGQLANFGMDFPVPKKKDVKGWKIAQGLFELGAVFQTCGCTGLGFVPKSKPEYLEYLDQKLNHYQNKLVELKNEIGLSSYQRNEIGQYWQSRVLLVESAKRKL